LYTSWCNPSCKKLIPFEEKETANLSAVWPAELLYATAAAYLRIIVCRIADVQSVGMKLNLSTEYSGT